ncbi:MAG: cellulase family glycosylhydrolase [Ruminococcus sp.]|nr:cellulase family glycosylhydrolase [Ruminococcus sp.]
MKFKRIFSLFTAAAVISAATGCGKTAEIQPDETSVPAEQTLEQTADSPDSSDGFVSSKASEYDKLRISVDGSKFKVDGKELWINDVNTPWQNWNDFGGNFEEEFWDSHFEELHKAGVNATRIWVNCNGMSIVRLKSDGTVQQVKDQHWTDLDKLFELAEKHDIYVMATLLSFDHFKDGNAGCENFRALVQSEEATQSYIDEYVVPFVKRYGGSPSLWSIDLMNEPDWVKENAECGQIGWEHLSRFFAQCSAAIHDNSDELVTVGLGMIKYNSDKYDGNYVSDEYFKELAGDSAYLDFYSPHYYFWQNSYMGYPFEQSPVSFGLDGTKPAVIGEAAVLSESGRTADQDYENAYSNGWDGVMAWTSNGVDACGSLDDLMPAVTKMKETAVDKIFPLGYEE